MTYNSVGGSETKALLFKISFLFIGGSIWLIDKSVIRYYFMLEVFYATDIMIDEQKVKIVELRKIRKKKK